MIVNTRYIPALSRYAVGMSDLIELHSAAYKAERAASRKLAAAAGIAQALALRQTLEDVAGSKGLDCLLAERQALRLAAEARDTERTTARSRRKAQAMAERQARHDGPPTPWRAWFDGSAHPNPGRCGIGGLLTGPDGERIEISRAAGHGNSSEAEYRALIAVLAAAVGCASHGLTIYGDSQVVVEDMKGAGAPALAEYRSAAHMLLAQLEGVSLRWIPRHRNGQADALSQRGVACAA